MLLSQQAELESFDSEKLTIALSPNWENMIKSRKVIIENTVKKIEQKTNSSTKISNEETYDDSSKNLANFFNGEIIDLDE